MEQIMIGADIFVQPCVDPSISSGPLHAMANGMPVVAIAGGASDYFVDDITAMLVEEASAAQLAEAIETLLDDHTQATRLAEGALNHLRTYHTISAMAEQTVNGYRAVLDQRRTYTLPR
jgi:glycosyltransferase involved in cell wall biosynthesis